MLNNEILEKFKIPGKLKKIENLSVGIINTTYLAIYEKNGEETKYIIQKINDNVFKNPYEVMNNIEQVTAFIEEKLKEKNDNSHKTLKVINNIDGTNLVITKNETGKNEFYRAYEFIEKAISYNKSDDEEIIKNVGQAFGNFQKLLNNFPVENLAETIKDFHNTKKRFIAFEDSVRKDVKKRANSVKKEIKFILDRKYLCDLIVDKLKNKEIPLRVTHNDTKASNVMLNKKTKEFVAVVDLDTVMPGSGLYDYGDGIRSASSSAREDETNMDNIFMHNNLFEAFTQGYLSELAPYIAEEEVKLMGKSIQIMTYELALRFLKDYLDGDIYFTCKYDEHNLNRARNQIKLVKDIESKMDYIDNYIWECYSKYKNKKI